MPEEKRELITTAGDGALGRVGNYVRGMTIAAAIGAHRSPFSSTKTAFSLNRSGSRTWLRVRLIASTTGPSRSAS